jgi:glycosyltransferase involved in cell wall biosynthesis
MISIITPSYNQLDWLGLAQASVADQEGVQVEHIVQDAGTPGFREAVEARRAVPHSDKHPRIYVEADEGMYDAINRGLQKARGEICAYLNCDEQYLPGALASVERFFADHPSMDVLFGDLVIVDQTGNPLSYRRTILPQRKHLRAAHLNTTTCATFFRRALWERGFHFDPQWKGIGDAVWVDQLLGSNIRMGLLPKPLAVFTLTGQNLGATKMCALESARWRREVGTGSFYTRLLAVLSHRLRKALAGAYKRRSIKISVFTLASPKQRVEMQAANIGFGWPSSPL